MTEKFGVMVGRFNPIHLGHEKTIQTMIDECGIQNCLIIIGSCNSPQSLRHFFSYTERKCMVKKLFPLLKVAPMADYTSNEDWFYAIDDIVRLTGNHATEVTFYCGCKEDVVILNSFTPNTRINNRYDGSSVIVSATQVRDALLHERSLDGLVNGKLHEELQRAFNRKWKEFEAR